MTEEHGTERKSIAQKERAGRVAQGEGNKSLATSVDERSETDETRATKIIEERGRRERRTRLMREAQETGARHRREAHETATRHMKQQ